MTDLSKLPWHECVLPRFNGRKYSVIYDRTFGRASIVNRRWNAIASLCEDSCDRWRIRESGTLCELRKILAMRRTVEAFIASHSK